ERVTVRSGIFQGDLSEIAGDVEDTYIGIEYRGKLPKIDASGFSGIVFIDLMHAGKRSGFNEDLARSALEKWKNLYIAGGLRLDDVAALNKMGFSGALIGTDLLREE
ncbi:MAG: HisA/HisF-related TIM barrel protein, partial [Candidatus Thermoplasmatota archaeon]|nr:HisA/HisF-related TIM barrel protein [Candidatus Thermoplasmatota archaeon]